MAFTTDKWTSVANDKYFTLTLHYTTVNFETRKFLLRLKVVEERCTAEITAELLNELLENWNFDHNELLLYVTTDREQALVAAINQMNCIHKRCFAHSLQLCITDLKNNLREFSQLWAKCRDIVTRVFSSPETERQFENLQRAHGVESSLKLIQDIATR